MVFFFGGSNFWCLNLLFFDWLHSQNNQQTQQQVNRNSQEEKDDKEKEKEVDREEDKAEGDEKEDGMKWVSFSFTRLLSLSSHTYPSAVFSLHFLLSNPLNLWPYSLIFSVIQLKQQRHSYITGRWKKHSADLPLNASAKVLWFRALKSSLGFTYYRIELWSWYQNFSCQYQIFFCHITNFISTVKVINKVNPNTKKVKYTECKSVYKIIKNIYSLKYIYMHFNKYFIF